MISIGETSSKFSGGVCQNQDQFLNMDIVKDLSHLFDGFLIDLTNIGAGDAQSPDKKELITHFTQLLSGDEQVQTTLNNKVMRSTNSQYSTGL